MYLVLFLLRGRLPWHDSLHKCKGNNRNEKLERLKEAKRRMTFPEIQKHFPSELRPLYDYVTALGFRKEPDYEFVIKELGRLCRPLAVKTASSTFSGELHRILPNAEPSKEAPPKDIHERSSCLLQRSFAFTLKSNEKTITLLASHAHSGSKEQSGECPQNQLLDRQRRKSRFGL